MPSGLFGVGLNTIAAEAKERRKVAAWNKARPVFGYDPGAVRMDDHGWVIAWPEYGNRDSDYGWEIDHIHPVALGGSDSLDNLRALHWRVNAGLGGLLSGVTR